MGLRYLLSSEISGDLTIPHKYSKVAMRFLRKCFHGIGNDIPVPMLVKTSVEVR